MNCSECKAPVRKGDGRFCSHCGTTLPDAPRITPDEWAVHPERFDEAEASDAVAKAMTAQAPPASLLAILFPMVFLGFWVGIGSFMLSMASEAPIFFTLAAGTILSIGVIGVGSVIVNGIRFSRSPVERRVLAVIDKRIRVRGGGDDTAATTHYFATLADRDGGRTEFKTTGPVAGQIATGDIGLALVRMKTLVAFHRA